jgi:dephospho-CoA kinase
LHFSLSDIIRLHLKKQGLEPIRDNMIVAGRYLRERYGNSVLAAKTNKLLKKDRPYIVTSIRHPDEVSTLRKNKNFTLVNIDAPARVRYVRMLKRRRPGDPSTFAKFIAYEKKEANAKGSGQQVAKCIKMADHVLLNDGKTLKKLAVQIDKLIEKLGALI